MSFETDNCSPEDHWHRSPVFIDEVGGVEEWYCNYCEAEYAKGVA